MGNTVNEKDWELFRSKVPGWQEAYIDKLNHEYIALLSEEGPFASEKFWELWGRIRKDRKDTGVIVEMTRSKMDQNLLSLLKEGAITLDDLKDVNALATKVASFPRGEVRKNQPCTPAHLK